MQFWQAFYHDEQHDLDCIIENHYDDDHADESFKMCIDGVSFLGSGFDDWELSLLEKEENISNISNWFSLLKYGSKESGYHYLLQSYRLQIKIPAIIFSLTEKKELSAELDIAFNNAFQDKSRVVYSLDGKKVKPNITACERFALHIGDKKYEAVNPSLFFEDPLQSICRQISGDYLLCNCFGCQYSDYSPYGQGNIGNLCCFVKNKEKYLKVYSKYEGEYTIWDAFNDGFVQCQETAICEQFAPRINCLGGYRGRIYGE